MLLQVYLQNSLKVPLLIQVFEQDPSKVPLEDTFQIPLKVFFFFGTGYRFLSKSFFTGFFQGKFLFKVLKGSTKGPLFFQVPIDTGFFRESFKNSFISAGFFSGFLNSPFIGTDFISGSCKGSSSEYFPISFKGFFSFFAQVTGSSPQVSLQDSSKVSLLV